VPQLLRPGMVRRVGGDQPPPEALVLRFPPGGQDQINKIRQEAKYVHRHHQGQAQEPWYRLSIWADVARGGETHLELMQRLVKVAGMGRIQLDAERNSLFWWTEAGRLYDAGFTIRKDMDPGEPPEHYSVDLGDNPDRQVVERFAAAFRGPERTGDRR
jgi:hypothetical protein